MRCIIIQVEYSMRGKPKNVEIRTIIQYLTKTYNVQPQIQGNSLKLMVDSLKQSTDIINCLSGLFPYLFEPVPPPYEFNMETLKE